MTPLVAVNRTPTVCPLCGSSLSLPLGSKAKPGMVVQTCKNLQHCGRSVWTEREDVRTEPIVDDGSRHGRMFQIDAPPVLVAPNRWRTPAQIARLARHELRALNLSDRKLAAAGGDR